MYRVAVKGPTIKRPTGERTDNQYTDKSKDRHGHCTDRSKDRHGHCTDRSKDRHGYCTDRSKDRHGQVTDMVIVPTVHKTDTDGSNFPGIFEDIFRHIDILKAYLEGASQAYL